MLEPSSALVPAPGTVSSSVLHSLGVACMESGDLEGAEQALSAAIEQSEEDGDPRLATRAALERLGLRQLTGWVTDDEASAEAKRAVSGLERQPHCGRPSICISARHLARCGPRPHALEELAALPPP